MINNLHELVEKTRIWAAEEPIDLAAKTVIRQPGLSAGAINQTELAVGPLSRTYRRCIADLALKGVNMGLFRLWPDGFSGKDMAEDIITANTLEVNPFLQFLGKEKLVQVAILDTDPLAVGAIARSGDEDVVYQIDTIDPWHPKLKRLARDFERFLLAAGNLMSIRGEMSDADDPAAIADDFFECLRELEFADEEIENWRPIAEVTFS